eukprot:SAG22_NODE_6049_length_909_cov_2.770833_1_plen_169_part_00
MRFRCHRYAALKFVLVDAAAVQSDYWLLLWTSAGVSALFRLLACGQVFAHSRRHGVVEPVRAAGTVPPSLPFHCPSLPVPAVPTHSPPGLVPWIAGCCWWLLLLQDVYRGLVARADRCDDFLSAVRFWLVLDRLQNGYLTTADFVAVLRALNGGKLGALIVPGTVAVF